MLRHAGATLWCTLSLHITGHYIDIFIASVSVLSETGCSSFWRKVHQLCSDDGRHFTSSHISPCCNIFIATITIYLPKSGKILYERWTAPAHNGRHSPIPAVLPHVTDISRYVATKFYLLHEAHDVGRVHCNRTPCINNVFYRVRFQIAIVTPFIIDVLRVKQRTGIFRATKKPHAQDSGLSVP